MLDKISNNNKKAIPQTKDCRVRKWPSMWSVSLATNGVFWPCVGVFLHYCWVTGSKYPFCWVVWVLGTASQCPNLTLRLTVIHIFLPLTQPFLLKIQYFILQVKASAKAEGVRRHSDRFVVRNSFSLYENKNKLAGAVLRISDMWFPVQKKEMRGNQRARLGRLLDAFSIRPLFHPDSSPHVPLKLVFYQFFSKMGKKWGYICCKTAFQNYDLSKLVILKCFGKLCGTQSNQTRRRIND